MVSDSVVHERNKAILLSLSEEQREYEYRLNKQTLSRDTKRPAVHDLNKWRRRQDRVL